MTTELEFIELINWSEKRMASKQIKALSEHNYDKTSNDRSYINQNETYNDYLLILFFIVKIAFIAWIEFSFSSKILMYEKQLFNNKNHLMNE